MNIKVINAGNCTMCGREIKIVTRKKIIRNSQTYSFARDVRSED